MLVDSVLTPPGARCVCGETIDSLVAHAIPTDDDTADDAGSRLVCDTCLYRWTAEEIDSQPGVSDGAVRQWLEGVSP